MPHRWPSWTCRPGRARSSCAAAVTPTTCRAAISSTPRPARCGRCRSTSARLETRGTPVPVVPEVVTTANGGVDAVVAGDGTLAYVSGRRGGADALRTLVWVDRQGRETPIPAPPRAYFHPAAVARWHARRGVSAVDQESRHLGLGSGAARRSPAVTSDLVMIAIPVWTPDGQRVIFSSDAPGARNLFWQAADGTGAVEPLTEKSQRASRDGRVARRPPADLHRESPKTGEDVMQMAVGRDAITVTPLVQSPFSERNGVVSPDGRWLAYEANDSGRFEIFVRPFPDVNSGPLAGVHGRRHAAALGAQRARAVLCLPERVRSCGWGSSAARRGRPRRRRCW